METSTAQILVVDDEPHLRNAVHRILEREGYEVTTAPDGETALGLVRAREPDIVLLDVIMPGMDGREVCRQVREFTTSTQIIYFTGKHEPGDPKGMRELRSEADAFLAKPASVKQILSRISTVLRRTRR